MNRFQILLLCIIVLFAHLASAQGLYDHTSAVSVLNRSNFNKRVTSDRKKGIKIVHFYSMDDGVSADHKSDFEEFVKKNKGMYEMMAINCDQNPDVCEKEGVSEYPHFRIYPAYPMPTVDLKKDKYSFKKLLKKASKLVHDRTIAITGVNHDTFIEDHPGKAKVLLFTKSPETPALYKALASNFDKTLFFGVVSETETSLVKKYGVKEFPMIVLVKPGDKPRKFDKEVNYFNLYNFINVYSEIFDFGDNSKLEAVSAASKSWLSSKFPELTAESSQDL